MSSESLHEILEDLENTDDDGSIPSSMETLPWENENASITDEDYDATIHSLPGSELRTETEIPYYELSSNEEDNIPLSEVATVRCIESDVFQNAGSQLRPEAENQYDETSSDEEDNIPLSKLQTVRQTESDYFPNTDSSFAIDLSHLRCSTVPASKSFIIQPKQVQQNNIELFKQDHQITKDLVKKPKKIVKTAKKKIVKTTKKKIVKTTKKKTKKKIEKTTKKKIVKTTKKPAKKPKVKENKTEIKGYKCGMCWSIFPNCDQLEVHKCPNAINTCNCTLCLAAKKARSLSQKKYKCCSMCSTYYKCVHYLKKHVDRYHGSCTCRICKTKFKTRLQCCKHRCRGLREDSEIYPDSDSIDEQLEDIEVNNTNTSTNEVLQDNDIEIEYIIESERPDSPPINFTSIQRKEDVAKVLEDTDNSSHIILETPVLIDVQNSTFLANEVNIKEGLIGDKDLNITDNYSKSNLKEQKDVQNGNINFIQIQSQEIEIVTIEGSDDENNLKSENIVESAFSNMRNDDMDQDIKAKTDVTMEVSGDIKTVDSVMATNDGVNTNSNETDRVIIRNKDNDVSKTYSDNSETEIDYIIIPDSDDETIISETELDLIEGYKITNEIMDTEIREGTDDIASNEEMHYKRKSNLDKSRSSISHDNSQSESTLTLKSKIDTVTGIKNTTLRVYTCNTCKKKFCKESDLMLHKKHRELERDSNTSLANLETCKYCNLSLSKTDLHDHMLFYHNQSEHFVNLEDNISEQQVLDKTTKDFQCRICTEVYNDKWVLKHHIELVHKMDDSIKATQIQPNIIRESYLDFKDF